jgi:putative transposase
MRHIRIWDTGEYVMNWTETTGILKREMYYGHKFTSRDDLTQAISDYIYFYNYQRLQRHLSVMTPMEFHERYVKAA